MTVQLPAELQYGKVVGRWLVLKADTISDPDELPDIAPATGSGTITTTGSYTLPDSFQNDGTWVNVFSDTYPVVLNESGELALLNSPNVGVWLLAGEYQVSLNIDGLGAVNGSILVEPTHTALAPLDLTRELS